MNKPKIAIVGYGRMGKEIEKLAKENGFTITDIFDIHNPITKAKYDFDVAIDFTTADAFLENLNIYVDIEKNVVVGTTGWFDKLDYVKSIIEQSNIGLVYSSNFSIGIQIFFKVIQEISAIINNYPNYDIIISEIHHKNKRDFPSGTALKISEIILQTIERKNKWITTPSGLSDECLQISSIRVGNEVGTHTVLFDSEFDSIELTHRAKNRLGFAYGALLACEFIFGKKGLYEYKI